nr:hypothetical protein [Nocardia arthritidis]
MDKSIGGHVLRHLYADESHAELSITMQDRRIQYGLTSEAQSLVIPDEELVQAICDLVGLHERFESGLCAATYRFSKDSNGKWKMVGHFSYAEDEGHD